MKKKPLSLEQEQILLLKKAVKKSGSLPILKEEPYEALKHLFKFKGGFLSVNKKDELSLTATFIGVDK